uniref:PH domain-containing protein n=1 Tax=Anopheles epiroticus TaxID=199890 RepID=A0A182PM30_9DIPT
MMKGVRRGCVRLKGAIIGIDDQDVNTFTITVDHKTFHFQARDAEEREKWVRRLEDSILRHANRSRALWDQQYNNGSGSTSAQSSAMGFTSGGPGGGSSAGGAGICTPGPSIRRSNNLVLFDRKVTEADAFLQLMIDQTTKLDARLETLGDTEEATQLKTINEHANAMLDNIKHAIVLLQIAKASISAEEDSSRQHIKKFVGIFPQNTANPINGIYQGPISSKSETETEPSESGLAVGVMSSSLPADIEVADECRESSRRANIASISVLLLVLARHALTAKRNRRRRRRRRHPSIVMITEPLHTFSTVPETSYSSSEGEDDFFDANDSPFTSSQLNTPTR